MYSADISVPSVTILVAGALLLSAGCNDDGESAHSPLGPEDQLAEDGTGVPGLDTPEQILANPYVEEALQAADTAGVTIAPKHAKDPPVISGTYDISGEAMAPGYLDWYSLPGGSWKWYNQTEDNHIDTEYDQLGLQTGTGGGEIIRGSGDEFTVYSVLEISDFCQETAVMLVDGEQDNEGNINADYVVVPAEDPVCHVLTIGRLNLTLTGNRASSIRETTQPSLVLAQTDSDSTLCNFIAQLVLAAMLR